jgi:PAS domain S-box-containing protein
MSPINSMTTLEEAARLEALRSYKVLDASPIAQLDTLTALAAQICGAPISLVSLVDENRQWFLSRFGLDVLETPRSHAFCAHAIHADDLFEVPDASLDDRFKGNPLVTGVPGIRFYAGMPLFNEQHQALGTLCVIDRRPRQLTTEERGALRALRDFVMAHLELRRKSMQLEQAERRSREIIDNSLGLVCAHGLDGTLRMANPAAAAALGCSPEDLVGRSLTEFMHPDDARHIAGYLERLADIGRDEGLLPVMRRDGARRVWRYKSVVSHIAGEEPLVVGHALDVTDDA